VTEYSLFRSKKASVGHIFLLIARSAAMKGQGVRSLITCITCSSKAVTGNDAAKGVTDS
jgi:hypothetical protein